MYVCLFEMDKAARHFIKHIFFFPFSPQDSSQIDLLKELMDLQKDMVVMLLSMLEGRFFSIVRLNIKA